MNHSHLPPEVLELYVIDGLEPGASQEVEAHVSRCLQCAAALEAEAALEAKLSLVAHASTSSEPQPARAMRPRWHRRTTWATAAISAAAMILFAIAARRMERGGSASTALPPLTDGEPRVWVSCTDLVEIESCIEDARFSGLLVQEPDLAEVPRYEEFAVLDAVVVPFGFGVQP